MIHEIVVNKWGYKLFFVESICDDPQIIEQNIMVCSMDIMLHYAYEARKIDWINLLPLFFRNK